MAFSRNSLVAAVAGTLSLAMLTGCPSPTPAPVGTPTPGGQASTPVTQPSAPVASGEPTATPSPVQSAANVGNVTVKGNVFDLAGARVDGAKVQIKSLNASTPFDTTVDVVGGAYVANGVPAGTQLQISAIKDGWTSRSRIESFSPADQNNTPNVVNFGGAAVTGDSEGPAYFISKYPEIAAVDPAEDATGVDNTKVVVKLTLSEALDSNNQRRFADAIRVFPTGTGPNPTSGTAFELSFASDSFANGTASLDTATDLEDVIESRVYNVDSDAPFFVDQSSTFLGEENTQASVTWDAEGKVATLTFNAPLAASEDEALKYQIGLASDGTNVIEDKDGNDLGMGGGKFGAYIGLNTSGLLINNVFKETDLALDTVANSAEERWMLTHTHVSTFEVAEDDTEPTLTGVTVSKPSSMTRISLTFSEPMGAYAGNSPENSIDRLPTLSGDGSAVFSFAVAKTAADLDDVDLDGDAGDVTAAANRKYGEISGERETEFVLTGASVSLNPNDAKVVRLEVPSTTFFSTEVSAIKARVEGLADPAGNSITERSADNNQKVGTI